MIKAGLIGQGTVNINVLKLTDFNCFLLPSVKNLGEYYKKDDMIVEVHNFVNQGILEYLKTLGKRYECVLYINKNNKEIEFLKEYFNIRLIDFDYLIELSKERMFGSSFDYCINILLQEKEFDCLYITGYDMSTNTEYRNQVITANFWIGYLKGIGKKVEVIEPSELYYNPYLYALQKPILNEEKFLTREAFLENELRKRENRIQEMSLDYMYKKGLYDGKNIKDIELENKLLELDNEIRLIREEVRYFQGALEQLKHFKKMLLLQE